MIFLKSFSKKKWPIVLIGLCLCFQVNAKSWKEVVEGRVLKDSVLPLCEEDIYKVKGGTSPLMKKVITAVNKVKKKATVKPKFIFTKGYVDLDVYRGGDEIFGKMAKMIENAEKEVLIQTFIFDMNSPSATMVYDAIVKLEKKRKKMKAKEPVVVRFLFDIMGSRKGANVFELMTWAVFGGRKTTLKDNENYQIEFPKKLDPKYVRFEIKGHRHGNFIAVTHSKTIVVDRKVSMVMGANFIGYHHTSESDTPMGTDLMVDHGFIVHGQPALGLADEFYNLWFKNKGKMLGFSSQYNGNVVADKYLKWDRKPFVPFKMNTAVQALKGNRVLGPVLVGNVGRHADGRRRNKDSAINPQNAAFKAIMRNAKSHVNIVSPSLNSWSFMKLIVETLKRGVDVNFLLSKNYQDYNKLYQEAGTNNDAVNWIRKKWLKLDPNKLKSSVNFLAQTQKQLLRKEAGKPKFKRKRIGDFNLTWFVTRGGNVSGKDKGKFYRYSTRIREKFYNQNHTKYLSADNQVSLVGSANIDEQSWFNSREANIIVDSHEVAKVWCRKTFKTDFMRGQRWGRKFDVGEACRYHSQCDSGKCDSKILKKSSKTCVYKKGRGLSGDYCTKSRQCKSNDCDPRKMKCN